MYVTIFKRTALNLIYGNLVATSITQIDIDFQRKNRRFEEAVCHARQFYLLTLPVDEVVPQDYLTNCITDGVEKGQYPSNVLAMHHGIYWHRVLVEDEGRDYPVAEVALAPLRSYIYSMVLSPSNNRVEEFGRTTDREFSQCYVSLVEVVPFKISMASLVDFFRLWLYFLDVIVSSSILVSLSNIVVVSSNCCNIFYWFDSSLASVVSPSVATVSWSSN